MVIVGRRTDEHCFRGEVGIGSKSQLVSRESDSSVEILARDNDVSDIVLHLSSLSTEFILWELPCFNGPGGAVMASLHRSSSVTMLQSIADDAAI